MHGEPENFLGVPHDEAAYETARFAILPVPYDATTSYATGTRDGPRAIINASRQVEVYDTQLGAEAYRGGIATLDPVEPQAAGPDRMHERIFKAARNVVRDGKFLIGLGGEHGISSALVRAVQSKHKQLSVLQIDAHADLRDSYQDTPFSHASVMRRIHELDVPAVAVGIRSHSVEEARFIRREKKPVFYADALRRDDNWIPAAVDALPTDDVYVTIDIDGFDPAYAPGTGTPEPGGLDWYHVTDLLAQLAQRKRIVAADVVEVRPIPPNHVTEFLAARLVFRMMGLVCRQQTERK